MPLVIQDDKVKWSEVLDKVHISVPLPDRYAKDTSILCSSHYLQVSSPPYIWECILYDSIDSEKSAARIGGGLVSFELIKKEKKTWGCLKHSNAGDKLFCKEQRKKALEEIQSDMKTKSDLKSKQKYEKGREAVRKQMQIDEMERNRIEKAKLAEKQRIDDEIKRWQKESVIRERVTSSSKCSHKYKAKAKVAVEPPPPPRPIGEITVTFTPRVFPTAARESQELEEAQWLQTQRAASRSLEFDCADLRPEERNPTWLEGKGDSLCELGDYRGAVNAYSLAMRMCPNKPSIYANRASCHLRLNNLHKAIEDSSKALELLNPSDVSNMSIRIKNHICRGQAFSQLELYVEGLMDFEAALKMDPGNDSLKQEADRVRALISLSSSATED